MFFFMALFTNTASAKKNTPHDLTLAKNVIHLESKALEALASYLSTSFVEALDTIESLTGRLILTGMGKSGHIARKIASTCASLGIPSLYVHPAEASHGDLGLVTQKDAVLALSNSGETKELSDILAHVKRHRIPLVAMTQKPQSSLAKASNVLLELPKMQEACPLGLAPTTSTTMMLAYGDALAVCLLKRRGFTPQDFGMLHPGGKLGKRLLTVATLMHPHDTLPLVSRETPMTDVLVDMSCKAFGCVGVMDDLGHLCGMITDGDLRRHMGAGLMAQKAEDVMSKSPKVITQDMLAVDALALMELHRITALFVVDSETKVPMGLVHIHDCLRAGLV